MPTRTQSTKLTKTKTARPVGKALVKKGSTAVAPHHTLAESEKIIDQQLQGTIKASIVIGEELRCIRDNKTYTEGNQRSASYTTFESFCERTYPQWGVRRCEQLALEAEKKTELRTVVRNSSLDLLNERATRELPNPRREPKNFRRVSTAVVREYPDPAKPPTARQVREVRERVAPKSLSRRGTSVDEARAGRTKVQGLLDKAVRSSETAERHVSIDKAYELIKKHNLRVKWTVEIV